jgi:tetratricopeptide (TPR) repeat protein
MRWQHLEYTAKGVFLALLVFIALQQPDGNRVESLLLWLAGGLGVSLVGAAVSALARGFRVKGKLMPFFLFLILENPLLTYAGILAGIIVAAYLTPIVTEPWLLPALLAGGVLLGVAFPMVLSVKHPLMRSLFSLLLALAPVGAVLGWLHMHDPELTRAAQAGLTLLVGLPFFYLLTFAGRAEESEVEIGQVATLLGVGILLWQPNTPGMRALALVLGAALYYAYTVRYLPAVRVFKHTMRGITYASAGRHAHALRTFRRALELDPRNKLARSHYWEVHRSLDLVAAAKDPELAALVDPALCMERAGSLLMDARPTTAQIQESLNLLDFVLSQRPTQKPAVLYWRCVAHLKLGEVERAAEELSAIFDPTGYPPGDPQREAILLQAWQLALILHPEMQKRVGATQLGIPGRRMDAIAAVERSLAKNPDNPTAWDLKRILYTNITEADYNQAVGKEGIAAEFDHTYVQQLGLALIQDRARWQRGAEFLRVAARGLPAQGPSIFVQVAQAANKAGDPDSSWYYFRMAQHAGRVIGPKNLAEPDKGAYFGTVRMLAESAAARGDLDAAIESYTLYTESEASGVDTLRHLANLYEKKAAKDNDNACVLNALRMTEQGLMYNSSDKDLLERKDRYYNDLEPATVKPKLESIKKWFDLSYCLRKAKTILDSKNADLDMVEWALRLAVLARAVAEKSIAARVCEARARLRKGERDAALSILEDLREAAPKEFPGEDDQDSWYVANRVLGDLYLNEVARPDLAIPCYVEYRKSSRSGADTLYKIGQAYESCGDLKKAAKYYENVTAYDGHPLMYEARAALSRVQSGQETRQ